MIFFYRINYDYIIFSGKDRADLLHRLSTNDLTNFGEFKGKKTILTTDKGRIVDLLTLYNFKDFIFATCSYGNSFNVIKHLDKYTIMEDFKVKDMSGTHEAILFFGFRSIELCKGLFDIELTKFTENDFSIYILKGKHLLIARNDDAPGGFILIYAIEDREVIADQILNSDALKKYPAEMINDAKFEKLRIESGIPKLGYEMGEHANPLECNLNRYISFTKGCYIGQEVIARLDTYDKISKHLVGIKAEEKLPKEVSPDKPKIIFDNKECGIITSTAESEEFGHIGLGFIRTTFLDYEKVYRIKSNGNMISSRAVQLPFKSSLN